MLRLRVNKKLLLLVAILLIGVVLAGCAQTSAQPRGWSGGIVSDGNIFFGSMDGRLVKIEIGTGQVQSSEALKGATTASTFGCASAPAALAVYGAPSVTDGLAYVAGYSGVVYAFNGDTLRERWIYPRAGNLQPIVGGTVVTNNELIFGDSNGIVYALDAATGDSIWTYQTGDKIWSTPAVDGSLVYVGSFDKKLYALNATDGTKRWEVSLDGAISASPIVANGTVYVGSFDRHVYALDASSGQIKWRSAVTAGNWFWAQPVLYQNVIYAGNLDGKVYMFNARTGEEAAPAIDLGSPIPSAPTLVGSSVVFAASEGQVYVIDTGSKQATQLVNLNEKVNAPLWSYQDNVYVQTDKGNVYEVRLPAGSIRLVFSINK